MDINKYKEIVNKTAIYPQTVNNFGKMYTYLGLIGEYYEMTNAFEKIVYSLSLPSKEDINAVSKEIGDVIWYITAMSKEFDLPINKIEEFLNREITTQYLSDDELLIDAESINFSIHAESFKKFYRDSKEIDSASILSTISLVCEVITEIMQSLELNLEDVLTQNYNKLMKRRETNTLHGDGDNREEASNA